MTEIIEGEIVEIPKSNEIYLALFNQGKGWVVSGIIYHQPDEIARNLAAFVPEKILIVKVKVPEGIK